MTSKVCNLLTSSLFSFFILVVFAHAPVLADISVTQNGNGANATSSTDISSNNSNHISSANNAAITNSITTTSNTGANSAFAIMGGATAIVTGDSSTNMAVTNGVNQVAIDSGACCATPTNVNQSGNGSGSSDTVSISQNNTTNLSVNNTANIVNTLQAKSQTGDNDITFQNKGDGSIKTGNSHSKGIIKNVGINTAVITVPQSYEAESNMIIKNNGAISDNKSVLNQKYKVNIVKFDVADILNDMVLDANTGENDINFSSDNVSINTGDVQAGFLVLNEDLNANNIKVNCPCNKNVVEKTGKLGENAQPVVLKEGAITEPPSGSVSVPSASSPAIPGQGGVILGASILPVTGPTFSLKFVILGSMVLLLAGFALRRVAYQYGIVLETDQRTTIKQRNSFRKRI